MPSAAARGAAPAAVVPQIAGSAGAAAAAVPVPVMPELLQMWRQLVVRLAQQWPRVQGWAMGVGC